MHLFMNIAYLYICYSFKLWFPISSPCIFFPFPFHIVPPKQHRRIHRHVFRYLYTPLENYINLWNSTSFGTDIHRFLCRRHKLDSFYLCIFSQGCSYDFEWNLCCPVGRHVHVCIIYLFTGIYCNFRITGNFFWKLFRFRSLNMITKCKQAQTLLPSWEWAKLLKTI